MMEPVQAEDVWAMNAHGGASFNAIDESTARSNIVHALESNHRRSEVFDVVISLLCRHPKLATEPLYFSRFCECYVSPIYAFISRGARPEQIKAVYAVNPKAPAISANSLRRARVNAVAIQADESSYSPEIIIAISKTSMRFSFARYFLDNITFLVKKFPHLLMERDKGGLYAVNWLVRRRSDLTAKLVDNDASRVDELIRLMVEMSPSSCNEDLVKTSYFADCSEETMSTIINALPPTEIFKFQTKSHPNDEFSIDATPTTRHTRSKILAKMLPHLSELACGPCALHGFSISSLLHFFTRANTRQLRKLSLTMGAAASRVSCPADVLKSAICKCSNLQTLNVDFSFSVHDYFPSIVDGLSSRERPLSVLELKDFVLGCSFSLAQVLESGNIANRVCLKNFTLYAPFGAFVAQDEVENQQVSCLEELEIEMADISPEISKSLLSYASHISSLKRLKMSTVNCRLMVNVTQQVVELLSNNLLHLSLSSYHLQANLLVVCEVLKGNSILRSLELSAARGDNGNQKASGHPYASLAKVMETNTTLQKFETFLYQDEKESPTWSKISYLTQLNLFGRKKACSPDTTRGALVSLLCSGKGKVRHPVKIIYGLLRENPAWAGGVSQTKPCAVTSRDTDVLMEPVTKKTKTSHCNSTGSRICSHPTGIGTNLPAPLSGSTAMVCDED